MKINVVYGTILETNNYIVENNEECVIIDCSASMENFEYLLHNKTVKAVLLTHAHWDHFYTLEKFAVKYNVPVYMTKEAEAKLGKREHFIGDQNVCADASKFAINYIQDGDILDLIGLKIKVISTPGHTDCCVSYLIDNHLFSGDTLFNGGVGRTDLPTSSNLALKNSLDKLFSLPPETIVYPGHGPFTTIEEEKLNTLI